MKKILIVEDDNNIANAIAIRFKACGYEPILANDGVLGLSSAIHNEPSLILLDVNIPHGNGLVLAERFRRFPQTSKTPIIFVTASNNPDLWEKAIGLNAAGVFEKPYDAEELIAVARRALGEREDWQSRQVTPPPVARIPTTIENARKKILIIEDDRKIAMGLELRLKAAGYETATAADEFTGVASVTNLLPDLILLDISLAAGNGFMVAEKIQRLLPNPPRMIFLTASKQPGLRDKAMALGAAAFFEKPYEAADLLESIEEALDQRNLRRVVAC